MPVPATRPEQLQRWDFLLPRGGWVDTQIQLGDPPGLTFLHNFRVTRDGLETAPGWALVTSATLPGTQGDYLGVKSVLMPSGLAITFIFFKNAIYMFNPQNNSVTDVTPSGMPTLSEAPDVVYMLNKFYTVLPDGVYWLDIGDTTPVWTKINGSPGGKAIGVLGFRLVVGNITGGTGWDVVPYRIAWSGLNAPETWDVLQTIDLPNYDTILRLLAFGDSLIVITPHRFYAVSYTGNPVTPFAVALVNHLPSSITNPLQVQSIFIHDVKMLTYALQEGIFSFSGQESILLNANIFNAYREAVNENGVPNIGYDPTNAELWFYWYGTTQKTFVYQVLFRSWYSRDMLDYSHMAYYNTLSDPQIFPLFVRVPDNTTIEFWKLRSSSSVDQRRGVNAFAGEIITPIIELGAVGGLKTLVSTLHWWTTFGSPTQITGNFRINLVVSNSLPILTNNITWQEVAVLPVLGEMEEIGVSRTGRYVRAKIVADGLTTRVIWHGFSLFWR